jgi:hypothetical protein
MLPWVPLGPHDRKRNWLLAVLKSIVPAEVWLALVVPATRTAPLTLRAWSPADDEVPILTTPLK